MIAIKYPIPSICHFSFIQCTAAFAVQVIASLLYSVALVALLTLHDDLSSLIPAGKEYSLLMLYAHEEQGQQQSWRNSTETALPETGPARVEGAKMWKGEINTSGGKSRNNRQESISC